MHPYRTEIRPELAFEVGPVRGVKSLAATAGVGGSHRRLLRFVPFGGPRHHLGDPVGLLLLKIGGLADLNPGNRVAIDGGAPEGGGAVQHGHPSCGGFGPTVCQPRGGHGMPVRRPNHKKWRHADK
jgi:hypothetical protein